MTECSGGLGDSVRLFDHPGDTNIELVRRCAAGAGATNILLRVIR